MFTIQNHSTQAIRAAFLVSLISLGISNVAAGTDTVKPTPSQTEAAKKAQKERDFEHALAQSDGVVHPRESGKAKPAAKITKSANQKDLNFEHELVQADGVVHPRETVASKEAAERAAQKASFSGKTQRDLDFEYELRKTDGGYHPREVLKR